MHERKPPRGGPYSLAVFVQRAGCVLSLLPRDSHCSSASSASTTTSTSIIVIMVIVSSSSSSSSQRKYQATRPSPNSRPPFPLLGFFGRNQSPVSHVFHSALGAWRGASRLSDNATFVCRQTLREQVRRDVLLARAWRAGDFARAGELCAEKSERHIVAEQLQVVR